MEDCKTMKKLIQKVLRSIIAKAVILLLILILVNMALRSVFFRIDLTQDKRFSLSASTIELLNLLESEASVTIYLDGDLNQGFRELKMACNDLMREFNIHGKSKFSFTFTSPDNVASEERKKRLLKQLEDLDMAPINVVEEGKNGKIIQKPVYPWAAINYKEKTYPVRLLVNIPGKNGTENLNLSIQNLEYQFTDALRILSTSEPKKIAFIEGHGELNEDDVYDVTSALSHYYQIDRGVIGTNPTVLDPYQALIIAHPQQAYTEMEKFVLDQYIMKGGRVLWFLDGVAISLDSLSQNPMTIGLYHDVNLEDMLFRYGARVNPVLLQDMQCALIPINFAAQGQKADFHPVPWFYSPVMSSALKHPITTNLSPVRGNFTSSVDSVGTIPGLKRQVLLQSSAQTNVFQAPAPVNLDIAAQNMDSRYFNAGSKPVALLQEGVFPSVFKNRNIPAGLTVQRSAILTESKPTRMLIVGDGDILRNEVEGSGASRQLFPLNFDRYTRQELYGNKEFVVNAVNYLVEGEQWMQLRNRSFQLRLLDKTEANEKRGKWQILNVLLPFLILVVMGFLFTIYRRRKYSVRS